MPITVTVIGNKCSVGTDVGLEFSNDLQQLPLLLAVVCDVQSEFKIVHDLQRLVNISMPGVPFEAFEFFFDFGAQIRLVIGIDALGHRTNQRQLHRDVEPVEKMLGLRVQVHLEIADRIAAIGQECNRLVHLHPLRFKHLEQTAFRLGVVVIHKSKALRRSALLGHTFTYDHLEPSFGSRPLVFCMDITAIDPNDKRYGRLWKLIPVSLAAINENVALFPQFVFQPFGRLPYPLPNCRGTNVLADRKHLLQELDGEPVRNESSKLGLQIHQFRMSALRQWRRERAKTLPVLRLALATIKSRTLQLQLAKRRAKGNLVATFVGTLLAASRAEPLLCNNSPACRSTTVCAIPARIERASASVITSDSRRRLPRFKKRRRSLESPPDLRTLRAERVSLLSGTAMIIRHC